MSEMPEVERSVADRIMTLTLQRPAKKNALTLAMYETLTAGLREAADDPAIRVVVLRGSGGTFSSGNDIADFMKRPPTSSDSPVGRFLDALLAFPKPLVAVVEGLAIGVATTMLLHCDFAYAAEGTRFSTPFVTLGLCPEAASSYLLPRIAGERRAMEILVFGEPFGPDVAKDVGLVNEVLPAEKLYEYANGRVQRLAELPPSALRATKRLVRQGHADAVRDAMERESTEFFARLRSPEAAEAMLAFMQKRAPDFSKFE